MIKAIFWDNDGVLVDTEGIFFKANLEKFGNSGDITFNSLGRGG